MIKRILGSGQNPDDESDQQEEFGAPDPGVADLENRPSRRRTGLRQDLLEDVDVGQEVLAE